jgi:glycosyltransferase involved in cell wall biosynthesis
MIVRNERQCLAACLESVRGLPDEIVVVDTGSTDGTQEIASSHGARVIETPWNNDFSQARNLSLEQARGRWILVLDADESLSAADRDAVRVLLERNTPVEGAPAIAFTLVQKSPTAANGVGALLASIVRLFPNRPDVRFAWPIHEQVATSLSTAGIPVEATSITISHSGYSDPARNRQKQLRNREILESQVAAKQQVTPLTYFLLAGCHLDLDAVPAALENYEECVRLAALTTDHDDIRSGANVRIAQCFVRLQRFSEAIDHMPERYDSTWHPELVALRAQAEAALGRFDDARVWYEHIFLYAEHPRIPACDLAALKLEALKFLGDYWYKRDFRALAVALLRGAMALHRDGRDFTSADMENCYRALPVAS